MYIIIHRGATKEYIQKYTKNNINQSRWKPKKCSNNPKEGKKKHKKETEVTKRKQLIK